MKRFYILSLTAFLCVLCASAQSYYITGSAVPGGKTIPLEKWDDGSYKFHGTLLPGDLYIINTPEIGAITQYYAPQQVNSNIVCNGIQALLKRSADDAAWAVLFEADNYRFTISPSRLVTGEVFTWWYEAWIVGGCTEDGQGGWKLSAGKQMVQSEDDPYEWTWVGELKAYSSNEEPRRFKIIGQYDWGPKHLHPYKQDASILTAEKVIYNNSNDYKWTIEEDGYYRIKCNVFLETISGEYLGVNPPSDIGEELETATSVRAFGRTICVQSCEPVTVQLVSLSGQVVATAQGTDVKLQAPASGLYMVRADGHFTHFSRKVAVR
ncbi:MAG: SusF/SusE family outer membrane protein [Bacteroidaceae bacterium]|nr:SusF/SusE family outer membrane protein [Bacteroidaceae bacterium]